MNDILKYKCKWVWLEYDNLIIEQKQMMHDTRSSPTRDGRPANNPSRTPLLDLRHDVVSSLAADRPQKFSDEYQDQWQLNFLHHLARQIYDDDFGIGLSRQRYGDVEEQSRRKQMESRNKSRKKGMAKYKAYAVKMKIPSYQELTRPRRQIRNGDTVQCKNRAQLRGVYQQSRGIYQPSSVSRMEEVFRVNAREIAIAHVFESSNVNIFKKRPTKNNKNPTIRKRSIKTTEKKRDEEEAKASHNKFLKTSTSPKFNKKCVMSLDQSSLEPEANSIGIKQKNQIKMIEASKSKKGIALAKTYMKSPQKEKDDRSGFKFLEGKQFQDSTFKLLQKVDKAINFKKREKAQSPTKVGIYQNALQKTQKSKELKPFGSQFVQTSKTVIRTIYTSKDMIRANNNISKQARQFQQRRQSTNSKVFIFNSEDNYIKRLLAQGGWIHNHDHRSHFYHLKWVFKPDSIDYNLKPDQYVNHVKNSHELTSKHYLNKNLKSYLSSWPKLYQVYPHSYDFAKPAEKQDFYTHFKKQIMMNLLQNVYEYFLSVRQHKIQTLTRFYTNLLQQDGTYNHISAETEGSPLRKKHFRKIDMEDYKQYDNSFLVHMNLLIVALKYWRFFRKNEQLEQDDDKHFLIYREKQFEDNIQDLQKYSKMSVCYTSTAQSYFQRQFYATPSETAIERVVKEYIYFQRHLGRQWKVFGRGNIWIVKPCSASRGTGIYLANDCSEMLTDNRGIQSKIVQRYVQRPLLMRSGIAKGIKFDLRQWVLLRSVEPLEVYMFSHCYLRVCSQQFVISNIHNLKAHLTNYSFNKRHFQQPAESVIDQDTFQNLLLEERNVDFRETVRPKIKDIIIRSIKSTQHLISDCGQACFSLLGYDILLDDWCEPWLLEVNMSPACEQRTQWLKTYLDVMGKGLLKIVLPQSYVKNGIKPSGRGSELPVKKCWQGQQDFPQNELKKIKTEISQSNADNEEAASYVNAIFQINASKVNQQRQGDDAQQSELEEEGYEQLGEKITYAEFINEHKSEKMESEGENEESPERGVHWQNITFEQNNNELPVCLQQKFRNLELYLPQVEKSQLLSTKKNEVNLSPQAARNSPSVSVSPIKQKPIETSIMRLESQLKWQRICFQDYSGGRKDGETHFQLVGNKINPVAIAQIDKAIQHTETQMEKINHSCMLVQQAIKQYLSFKRAQKRSSPQRKGFNLKVSRLQQNQIRQSKSALYNHQEKSFFERPNKQAAQSRIQRPITARNISGPPSAKNRANDTFRQKIRSIALQAASRESCRQFQSNPIIEQICSSKASLGGPI